MTSMAPWWGNVVGRISPLRYWYDMEYLVETTLVI